MVRLRGFIIKTFITIVGNIMRSIIPFRKIEKNTSMNINGLGWE